MTMNPTAPVGATDETSPPASLPVSPATDESGPPAASPAPPTPDQFRAYQAMYDYFNRALFGGQLRPVLLNFSRHAGALGFFAPERWESQAGEGKAHEISINPQALRSLPPVEVASTLVHEMVHLWQHEHGEPSRTGYHNHEWGRKMESVGLVPSDTGKPGGKRSGRRWPITRPRGACSCALTRRCRPSAGCRGRGSRT